MKRHFRFLPIVLLLMANACGSSEEHGGSGDSTENHVTPPDTSMLNRDSVMQDADTASKTRDSARIQMGVQKP